MSAKVGLDDYFAQGGTAASLMDRIVDALPESEYEWSLPLTLEDRQVAPFDPSWLPGVLAAMAIETAESTQVPIDLPAAQGLGAISAAIGGKFEIVDPWPEPVHAQIISVMDSGNRKSGAHRLIVGPILDWERGTAADDRKALRKWESEQRVLEGQLKALEGAASNPTGKKAQELGDIDRKIAAAVEELENHRARKPKITQVIFDDATPERTKSLLYEQGGAGAVVSPEPAFFANAGGRYSDTPIWDLLLNGHSGDPMRTNRVGREGEYISRPSLTVCVCMQPVVVSQLGKLPGFREQGVAARLMPSIPASPLGFRKVMTDPVAEETRAEWANTLHRLLDLEPRNRVDADGVLLPYAIALAADARDAFHQFLIAHEPKLRPDGEFGEMTDWASKLPGQILRIAGLLHMVSTEDPCTVDIALLTIERAIAMGRYFASHARAMFDLMAGTTSTSSAKRVLAVIQRLGSPVSRRDVHKALYSDSRSRFRKAEELNEPLSLLEELGWIRVERVQTGGRPTQLIHLSPCATGDKSDESPPSPPWPPSADNVVMGGASISRLDEEDDCEYVEEVI